ncbi:MAG: transporter [Frankiales bacterium]|nr:transporter [Frankiales bacterium]
MTSPFATPQPDDLRGPFRYLLWLVREQRSRAVLAAILSTAWMLGLVALPYLLAGAIDHGLRRGGTADLLIWTAALFGVGLLNALMAILRHRTMTKIRMEGAFLTIHSVVEHTTRLGASLAKSVSAGEIATIGIGDVWTISTSLTVVGPGAGAVIAYLVVAVILVSIAPVLAAIVLLGVPAMGVLVGPLLGRLRDRGADYREQQSVVAAKLIDVVTGLSVLNSVGGKEFYAKQYGQRSQRLLRAGYRMGAVSSWVPAFAAGVPVVFLAVVTWVAARMAADATISIGDLVAVYGYAAMLVVPVAAVIDSATELNAAVVATNRVLALLRLSTPTAPARRAPTGPERGAPLVDSASGVVLKSGGLTMLVADAATEGLAVIDRLGGFEPSDATWGDIPIADVAPAEFRERVLVADHEAYVFAGPLRQILAGRRDREDSTIRQAIHAAAAEDVVAGLPFGLDTSLPTQASTLSGGQRQRIRLARALVADPEVLLAFEPTSAVDAHTEALVASRVRQLRQNRTTLIITTSPAMLDVADTVLFLVNGQVSDSGTHRQLSERQSTYRTLVHRNLESDSETSADPVPGRADRQLDVRHG